MTEFGVVTKSEDGRVTVMFSRPEACEKCGACGGSKHKHTLELPGEYEVGHWLRVEMPEGRFLSAASLAYSLPLGMLLLGLVLGYYLGGQTDISAAIGAGVFLALALILLKIIAPKLARDGKWSPQVTGEYDDKPTQADIGCSGAPANKK